MRGNQKVLKELNAALQAELTAIVQYMVQAEMCHNWGYQRLGELTKRRAIEEMKHAEGLIERILFLDGTPAIDVALQPKVGADVPKQLETDLADETDAVRQYNQSVKICRESGDAGSRELFEHMIVDEERHADFLEAQLHSIKEIGLANYLAEQLKEK
ncbi:MAG TPA: bacterioferritin [Terriglobales bacterium]|nr:bacterioferritin [Terriglobales bacterium]